MSSFSPSAREPLPGISLAWLLLALSALLVSGLFAIILVVLRTPYLAQWLGSALPFRTALVLHVDLAVVVWFLAVAGVFWSWLQRESLWSWLAWGFATMGVVAMLASPLAESGVAVINNYLPVVNGPTFLGGLALFIAGVALNAVLVLLPAPRATVLLWPVRAAVVVTLVALLLTLDAAWRLPVDGVRDNHWFESLFWGGGHVLQFVHTLLMLAVWWVLLSPAIDKERWLKLASLLGGVPVLFALPFTASLAINTPEYRGFYTDLMSYASWLPLLPMGVVLAGHRQDRGLATLVWGSALLFVLGIAMGVVIRGDDLVVTAHYHGTVGGVTLAFMGLALYGLGLPLLRGSVIYGGGLLLLILGLFWAGMSGAPRKSIFSPLHDGAWLDLLPPLLVGLGGLTALTGLFLFLYPALRAGLAALALRRSPLLVGGLAVAILGLLLQWFPPHPLPEPVPPMPQEVEDPALRLRFQQGAMMLHAGEYEHAVVAFHEVLAKQPRLPEAHLNLGFALLGLQRYEAARDFFLAAIDLRPVQANAYYGLAETYEAMEDFEAALGAMRTFIHMTQSKDPFLVKARAAIWEWESRLGRGQNDNPPSEKP